MENKTRTNTMSSGISLYSETIRNYMLHMEKRTVAKKKSRQRDKGIDSGGKLNAYAQICAKVCVCLCVSAPTEKTYRNHTSCNDTLLQAAFSYIYSYESEQYVNIYLTLKLKSYISVIFDLFSAFFINFTPFIVWQTL